MVHDLIPGLPALMVQCSWSQGLCLGSLDGQGLCCLGDILMVQAVSSRSYLPWCCSRILDVGLFQGVSCLYASPGLLIQRIVSSGRCLVLGGVSLRSCLLWCWSMALDCRDCLISGTLMFESSWPSEIVLSGRYFNADQELLIPNIVIELPWCSSGSLECKDCLKVHWSASKALDP